MTTKLKVDATRLLGSLKYAFAGSTAFIGELLQNARRAGADQVSVKITLYTPEGVEVKLTREDVARQVDSRTSWYSSVGPAATTVGFIDIKVDDNGRGVEDMQDLLHIAHSGWDDSVQHLEQPYGLGFMSAILAAKKVRVLSNGMQLTLDTDLLLADGESGIAINSGCALPEGSGTSVELIHVTMPPGTTPKEFLISFLKMISGFPLPVNLEGFGDVPRPRALTPGTPYWEEDTLVIMPTKVSGIHLYLQGLPIGTTSTVFPRLELHSYLPAGHHSAILSNGDCYDGIAVHLDSSYRGRMPDRAYLYEEKDAVVRIDRDLRKWQFRVLSDYLTRITGEALEKFTAACASVLEPKDMRHLFLYSNLLPGFCDISSLTPGMSPAWSHHFCNVELVTATRDAIAAGQVFHLTPESNVHATLLPRLLLRYKYFTAPSFQKAFPELLETCDSKADAGLPDMSRVDGMALCKKIQSREFKREGSDQVTVVRAGIYPSNINEGPLFGTVFVKDPRRTWCTADMNEEALVAFPSEISKLDKKVRALIASSIARLISPETRLDAPFTMFLLEVLGDDLTYIRGELTKVLSNHEDLRAVLAGRKLTLEMGADGDIKSIK